MMERKIYVFWTGDNEMTEIRKKSIIQLSEVSGCEIVLVTPHNLSKYILPNEPLHPSYEYLCLTHKADYLRTYFMNFHGGGYCDVKETTGSWLQSFEELEKNEDKWINGYQEADWSLVYKPYRELGKYLLGNCSYICKPDTPFTNKWYNSMMKVMDEKYELLKRYPAEHPQDSFEMSGGRYPIRWEEMLGDIFHRQVFRYHKHALYTLPAPNFKIQYR
jgi:hypothetical protein